MEEVVKLGFVFGIMIGLLVVAGVFLLDQHIRTKATEELAEEGENQ